MSFLYNKPFVVAVLILHDVKDEVQVKEILI